MKKTLPILLLSLAACATGEPSVVPREHPPRLAKAGILPGQSIPAEREGIHVEDTGAIMFVCANSDKHEDKEVFVSKCPSCGEQNYFYWDADETCFRCFACTKLVDAEVIKCPECGKPPRTVRTKPKPGK